MTKTILTDELEVLALAHVGAPLDLQMQANLPAMPLPGRVRVYPKADGELYLQREDGSEVCLKGTLAIPETTITLSNDSFEIGSATRYVLKAESGATDNLSTVTGGEAGNRIVLRAEAGQAITLKHGISNIALNGEADFILSGERQVELQYNGSHWTDLSVPGMGSGLNLNIGCRIYSTTNQSVASFTVTPIVFNSVQFDTDGMYSAGSPGRITFKTPGVYLTNLNFAFAASSGTLRLGLIRRNGTQWIGSVSAYPTSTDGAHISVSVIYKFEENDYIEGIAYQGNGSPLSTETFYAVSMAASRLADG